jgi:LasA protease
MKLTKHIPIVLLSGSLCISAQANDNILTEQDLIYTPDQMLNFSIDDYLRTYSPHLLPHAEAISHWAGVSTISPKILIALMEQQTSIVSIENSEAMSRPFGDLSDKVGFNEQLIDVCDQLANLHYSQTNSTNRQFSVIRFLSSHSSSQDALSRSLSNVSERFSNTYHQLFPYANPKHQTPNTQSPHNLYSRLLAPNTVPNLPVQ